MTFSADLQKFNVKIKSRNRLVFERATEAALASIQYGSPVTGAPGQPVDTSDLLHSWQITEPEANVRVIAPYGAPIAWAQQNEDGIARPGGGAYRLLSWAGGRFSVALTAAGFDKLVNAVVERLER